MQRDGMVEVILTPRTVTSHQCILLLFITRNHLPEGEQQSHHPGKNATGEAIWGTYGDAPGHQPEYPWSNFRDPPEVLWEVL